MFQPLETLANGLLPTSELPSDEHENRHCGDKKQKFRKVRGSKEHVDKRKETAFGPEYTNVFRIKTCSSNTLSKEHADGSRRFPS